MSKFLVQAARRSGFAGVWRAGRLWPSESPIEVEVLEQDECPQVPVEGAKPPRMQPDPSRIGRVAFAAVMKDGRLSKTPVDARDAANSMAKVVELGEENAALRADAAAKEACIAELRARLEAESTRSQTAEKDLDTLSRRVATLQAELDEARKRALSDEVTPVLLPRAEQEDEAQAEAPATRSPKRSGRR